jgi:hypothetical protein
MDSTNKEISIQSNSESIVLSLWLLRREMKIHPAAITTKRL